MKLPVPRTTGNVSLEEALSRRRSVRSFNAIALTPGQTSQLLWAAQGITDAENGFRTAPSAGAVYPLTLYLVNAEGLSRYDNAHHTLAPLQETDLRAALAAASFGQEMIAQAAATFIVAARYDAIRKRYGRLGVRYADMEAGHAAQNIHLQAAALGLGSVPVGAFDEKAVGELLRLPEHSVPIYLIPVGVPR